MKCAAELITIKQQAEYEHQMAMRKKDEECRARQAELKAVAINYCENYIGRELERLARENQIMYIRLDGIVRTDRLGKEYFYPLIETPHCYANGKSSFDPDMNNPLDLGAIVEYLDKFCIKVTSRVQHYDRYGWGTIRGLMLEIRPDPLCKK